MKKVILLALTVVALSSYGQKVRAYSQVEFYGRKDGKTSEYGNVTIKVVWNGDNDSPYNLSSIAYPNVKVVLDESPEFEGVNDQCPYYYFTGVADDNRYLEGVIVKFPDGDFSISLLLAEGKTQSAIFKKSKFKYVTAKK
jgi:hypothetical protein